MKKFFGALSRFFQHPWFMAVVVALIISAFAVWYGAAWSLIIALPLIYDYYIGHHIASFHKRMMERYKWWRVVYAVWCALVFALVVGVIAHMLIFRWNFYFLATLWWHRLTYSLLAIQLQLRSPYACRIPPFQGMCFPIP